MGGGDDTHGDAEDEGEDEGIDAEFDRDGDFACDDFVDGPAGIFKGGAEFAVDEVI